MRLSKKMDSSCCSVLRFGMFVLPCFDDADLPYRSSCLRPRAVSYEYKHVYMCRVVFISSARANSLTDLLISLFSYLFPAVYHQQVTRTRASLDFWLKKLSRFSRTSTPRRTLKVKEPIWFLVVWFFYPASSKKNVISLFVIVVSKSWSWEVFYYKY